MPILSIYRILFISSLPLYRHPYCIARFLLIHTSNIIYRCVSLFGLSLWHWSLTTPPCPHPPLLLLCAPVVASSNHLCFQLRWSYCHVQHMLPGGVTGWHEHQHPPLPPRQRSENSESTLLHLCPPYVSLSGTKSQQNTPSLNCQKQGPAAENINSNCLKLARQHWPKISVETCPIFPGSWDENNRWTHSSRQNDVHTISSSLSLMTSAV